MKKQISLFSCCLLLVFAGCRKNIVQSPGENVVSSQAEKPTTGGDVALTVTVVNSGTEINHDGKAGGVYAHGADKVDARILSSDGNFFFQTNTSDQRLPVRWLSFANPSSYPYTMQGKRNYTMRTNASTALQNMQPGDVQEVGFTVRGIDARGAVDWLLVFHNGIEANETSPTDFARVTKNADGTWTIEPANTSVVPATGGLYNANSSGNAIAGTGSYHVVPFKVILARR